MAREISLSSLHSLEEIATTNLWTVRDVGFLMFPPFNASTSINWVPPFKNSLDAPSHLLPPKEEIKKALWEDIHEKFI